MRPRPTLPTGDLAITITSAFYSSEIQKSRAVGLFDRAGEKEERRGGGSRVRKKRVDTGEKRKGARRENARRDEARQGVSKLAGGN